MGHSAVSEYSEMSEGSPWPSLAVLFPLPSERARAGLPMAARAADDRRAGAAAAAAQRLSSAGRRRGNRITKMIRPKKSHLSLHFSLSRRPPRSWDWVFPMALPPFYVAYLFSPCFGLSSCVFP